MKLKRNNNQQLSVPVQLKVRVLLPVQEDLESIPSTTKTTPTLPQTPTLFHRKIISDVLNTRRGPN